MRLISATMFVTLDGMWCRAWDAPTRTPAADSRTVQTGAMLFGRRTWQDFTAAWEGATEGNPFTEHMNAARKYIVSRTVLDAGARCWCAPRTRPG